MYALPNYFYFILMSQWVPLSQPLFGGRMTPWAANCRATLSLLRELPIRLPGTVFGIVMFILKVSPRCTQFPKPNDISCRAFISNCGITSYFLDFKLFRAFSGSFIIQSIVNNAAG